MPHPTSWLQTPLVWKRPLTVEQMPLIAQVRCMYVSGVYLYKDGSYYYPSLFNIGLWCSEAAAAAVRSQKFDLLTFQSPDHQCNGLADSTCTSCPVEPLTERLLNNACVLCEDFWSLSRSIEAMCSHARRDLFHLSAASMAHQWVLINWQKKTPPESLQMPNSVFT